MRLLILKIGRDTYNAGTPASLYHVVMCLHYLKVDGLSNDFESSQGIGEVRHFNCQHARARDRLATSVQSQRFPRTKSSG
jgi:hypothetical protein